jgi:hypothetical protein
VNGVAWEIRTKGVSGHFNDSSFKFSGKASFYGIEARAVSYRQSAISQTNSIWLKAESCWLCAEK